MKQKVFGIENKTLGTNSYFIMPEYNHFIWFWLILMAIGIIIITIYYIQRTSTIRSSQLEWNAKMLQGWEKQ